MEKETAIASQDDQRYMDLALRLAAKGLGATYPNPAVGCVIVARGEIVGSGYHHRAGEAHAEVNAVRSVEDRTVLPFSTMYVTLEPCAHYGKTPPCAEMIVRERIPRVVVGTLDPFAQVNGRGIEILRRAGVEVVVGVRQEACRTLNRRFFTYHRKKRPYLTLKWAQTADGFLDALRQGPQVPALKITGPQAQTYVHRMRSTEQAILVGTRTAILDNPRLDARFCDRVRRDPLRIAIDRRGRIPADYHLLDGTQPTIVFTDREHTVGERLPGRENLLYVPMDFSPHFLDDMLDELYRRGIQSVLVEGGAELLGSFIRSGLWDQAFVFTAPRMRIGRGVAAPSLGPQAREIRREVLGEDELTVYENVSNYL